MNEEKSKQLGMPFGTANGKLRKMILFHLLKKYNENFCYRCGAEIEHIDELSIEHKKPWLHENTDLFWDMDNIAFSHLHCNVSSAHKGKFLSQEHKTKIALSMMGKVGYWKGKSLPEKMKENISISKTGILTSKMKENTPLFKRGHIPWNKK